MMVEGRPEAFPHEAMLNEGEASLDGSDPLWIEQSFMDHGFSPFHGKAIRTDGKKAIESSFASIPCWGKILE